MQRKDVVWNESEECEVLDRKNVSPADDILISEAGFFYRRIVSAVSTVVSKTTSVGSNPAAPVYLRSIMEECNGFLIRRLQVRVLSQIRYRVK